MQSTKATSSRRASGPMPGNTRQVSETPKTSAQVSGVTRQSSEPQKAYGASTTSGVISTSKPAELPTTSSQATLSVPGDQIESPPIVEHFKPPLVLMPPSKISKGPRRNSRPEVPISERPLTWDPEHYNPDGSLRTMHKLPGFDQSYAQAMQARYIRHKQPVDREKELSVDEIFDKGDNK